MKRLKKLTVRAVVGDRVNEFQGEEPVGTELVVMTIYGRADKAESVESVGLSGDITRFTRFRGDFAAYRGPIGVGEQFRSATMILPETAAEILANLLNSAEINSANFGFQINVRKTDTPIGYEFRTLALIEEPADADPLASLATKLDARQAAAQGAAAVANFPGNVSNG